jgi:hypothetical protein
VIWFLGYLLVGAGFAYANDTLVIRDFSKDARAERVIYAVRAVLAWPTYLVEDAITLGRMDRGSED